MHGGGDPLPQPRVMIFQQATPYGPGPWRERYGVQCPRWPFRLERRRRRPRRGAGAGGAPAAGLAAEEGERARLDLEAKMLDNDALSDGDAEAAGLDVLG